MLLILLLSELTRMLFASRGMAGLLAWYLCRATKALSLAPCPLKEREDREAVPILFSEANGAAADRFAMDMMKIIGANNCRCRR
mmetsp:Transcript_36179/g.58994  ORF Transcript_36179/g.58994 Transcript_36179/m.58994 type:complete len:84 (-) Transcript_36179:153-404(-)